VVYGVADRVSPSRGVSIVLGRHGVRAYEALARRCMHRDAVWETALRTSLGMVTMG